MIINVDIAFPDDVRTMEFCDALEDDNAAMHLVRVWCWAMGQKNETGIAKMTPRQFSHYARYKGPAEAIWDAAIRCGFLEDLGNGEVRLVGWKRNVPYLKKLKRDARAQANKRSRDKESADESAPTSALTSARTSRESSTRSSTTRELPKNEQQPEGRTALFQATDKKHLTSPARAISVDSMRRESKQTEVKPDPDWERLVRFGEQQKWSYHGLMKADVVAKLRAILPIPDAHLQACADIVADREKQKGRPIRPGGWPYVVDMLVDMHHEAAAARAGATPGDTTRPPGRGAYRASSRVRHPDGRVIGYQAPASAAEFGEGGEVKL